MYPLEFKFFEYSLHKLNILKIKIIFAECNMVYREFISIQLHRHCVENETFYLIKRFKFALNYLNTLKFLQCIIKLSANLNIQFNV